MKHFLSITKIVAISATSILLYNCGEDTGGALSGTMFNNGQYRLSKEAHNYVIKDTVATTFTMIDDQGITDKFVNSPRYGSTYLEISKATKYHGSYESFYLHSHSPTNNYDFRYDLSAGMLSSVLSIQIDINDGISFGGGSALRYDFTSKTVATYLDPMPEVKFYEEMEVRGIVYHKIIEVDYSKDQDKLKNDFPIHIYYSAEKGLIKFIRKDGIFFERI